MHLSIRISKRRLRKLETKRLHQYYSFYGLSRGRYRKEIIEMDRILFEQNQMAIFEIRNLCVKTVLSLVKGKIKAVGIREETRCF